MHMNGYTEYLFQSIHSSYVILCIRTDQIVYRFAKEFNEIYYFFNFLFFILCRIIKNMRIEKVKSKKYKSIEKYVNFEKFKKRCECRKI